MTDVMAEDSATGVEGPNVLEAADEELMERLTGRACSGLQLDGEGGLRALTKRLMEFALEGEMTGLCCCCPHPVPPHELVPVAGAPLRIEEETAPGRTRVQSATLARLRGAFVADVDLRQLVAALLSERPSATSHAPVAELMCKPQAKGTDRSRRRTQ